LEPNASALATLAATSPYWGPFLIALVLVLWFMRDLFRMLVDQLTTRFDRLSDAVDNLRVTIVGSETLIISKQKPPTSTTIAQGDTK
jgi:hypothetical protein